MTLPPRSGSSRTRPSPRAMRAMMAMLATAVVVIPICAWLGRHMRDSSTAEGPRVGGGLHAVASADRKVFVSGHEGAGYLGRGGPWRQIESLGGTDVMAWAQTRDGLLAGGHAGLYRTTDGATFGRADTDLPLTDVHALGTAGETVYLASPQDGLFVSTDGGQTFTRRGGDGLSFVGSISVDNSDPGTAVAADKERGAVITRDGGVTWTRIGDAAGAMAVAVDPKDPRQMVTIGMDGASETTDGGASWTPLPVPENTSAATFDEQGRLLVAERAGDRAQVYRRNGASWIGLS
jgi:hypothetical protein